MHRYDPSLIEPKWEADWERAGLFRAVEKDDGRPRYYKLHMFPYPSGDLHMGHAEAFAISDIIARFMWMRGNNVLHPIGWDAFGLAAENAAIQRGVHPKEWTYANIADQERTFRRYGMAFDWSRKLATCDPEFYRWTQWLFLKLFEKGLAYRKLAPANWCPKDQTVLANEQVIQGRCERCGTPVVRKDLVQWFFKITDYADRLLDDMDQLEWSDRVLTLQRNWIGRSHGAEVTFEIAETGDRVSVFTTRPDTLWGVTFFAFAPEHPLVGKLAEAGGTAEPVKEMQDRLQRTQAAERDEALSREGIALGVHAVNPVNGEKVPCLVAPYVLMEYGTGSIMGVPFHDQRDFEFARDHGLDVRIVIQPEGEELDPERMTEAWTGEGVMVNSGPFDGRHTPEAIPDVIAWLEKEGKGRAATSYRLRDWLISRQRYWGAPIPIIHCPACGLVAVPERDLPVLLPEDVDFSPQGVSPLAKHEAFVNVTCPTCGSPARRETDTMDTFVDSSWYFLRYLSPHKDDGPFDDAAMRYWFPIDLYVGGTEHAILHLVYSRFWTKVMRDLGLVGFDEPVVRLFPQGMVHKDGEVMSKSRGNTVAPDDVIRAYGADTLRLYILSVAPPEMAMEWTDANIEGERRLIGRLWRLIDRHAEALAAEQRAALPKDLPPAGRELRRKVHQTIRKVTEDVDERIHLNTAVAAFHELVNEVYRLEAEISEGPARWALREAVETLVLLMDPFTPHVCEEMWARLGHAEGLLDHPWPMADEAAAAEDAVELAVQVNGKVRGHVLVARDASEEEVRRAALEEPRVREHLAGRPIAKFVLVPGRLV